jgi:Zn-dependent protease with chaperone function
VSVAICLLLYGAVVCVVAPRLLPYLTRSGSVPVAAVAVWLIVVVSVLASWIAAAAALAVHAARTWNQPDPMAVAACLAEVRSAAGGHSGPTIQIGLVVATLVVSAFVVVLASRAGRFLVGARARNRRHAQSARIIGRRVAGVGGLVVDAPQKMAYCLGGRPGTIVITSAAVAALERPHLDAVLAHERAHLAGRHHLLHAVMRALAASVPQIRLFTVAQAEVGRLLEMCADDSAARRHGTASLLAAILTLASPHPIPSAALGATSVGVCARVARLTDPDTAVRRLCASVLLAASAGVFVAAPLLAAFAAASGFTACGPFIA